MRRICAAAILAFPNPNCNEVVAPWQSFLSSLCRWAPCTHVQLRRLSSLLQIMQLRRICLLMRRFPPPRVFVFLRRLSSLLQIMQLRRICLLMRRFPPPRVFVFLNSTQVVRCLAINTDGHESNAATIAPSDRAAGSSASWGSNHAMGGGAGDGDPPRREQWNGVLAEFYCAQELCS